MELFVGLNRFLEECGVDHWVNFGTLLGFHRQGALLDHDIDIDMGCLEKDAARVWDARHRLPHGWVLHDTSFRHHGPKFYVSHRGFDGDIYFYREQGESLLPLEKTRWANYRRPIPRDLLLPTEMRQWVSEAPASSSSSDSSGFSSFRVPARVEDYLTFIYGSLAPDAKRDPESGFWV